MSADLFTTLYPIYAAVDAQDTFNSMIGNVKTAVQIIGGAMVAFGLVSLGLNLYNGSTGNGAAIGSSIGILVGGVLIFLAGTIIGNLTF